MALTNSLRVIWVRSRRWSTGRGAEESDMIESSNTVFRTGKWGHGCGCTIESARFALGCPERKLNRILLYAANLSSRSLHLAGVSITGFLWLFSQCAGTHHAFPKRRTTVDLYSQ